MGSRVDPTELVTTAEIAKRLGYRSADVVHQWRRRYPLFPEPVARIGHMHVWRWRDVEAWARRTRRLPKPIERDRR